MNAVRVVFDTNVIVAGLRSRLGASFQLLSLIGTGSFELAVSVPLVLEYEEVLARLVDEGMMEPADVQVVVDYICSVSHHQSVFYLWRPYLRDSGDDMVLELAVAAQCPLIVTHNVKDFVGSDSFGVNALLPGAFLNLIRRRS
jgi:putative PIN family toxin of toxin-antitoxin system